MTLEEWMQLPQATRLEVLYFALHDRLVTLPVPASIAPATAPASPGAVAPSQAPAVTPASDVKPPRFDVRIARRNGFQWASETVLSSLEWWHAKKLEGAAKGGKYAERDQKTADELARFIAWRRTDPAGRWSGVRGDKHVLALPPSRDPDVHPWGDRAPAKLMPAPAAGGFSDADYSSGEEEIPF